MNRGWIWVVCFIPLEWAFAQVTVIRGPYLQSGTPTSVVVRWRTDLPTDSRVYYTTNQNSSPSFASDIAVTTEHEVRLTGLTADTRYYYGIGYTGETIAEGDDYFFVTPPLGAKPTRIWVLGDSGTKNADAAAVRDAYKAFTGSRHTDIWLMLGDNAYGSGTDDEYTDAVFNMYPAMLRRSVLWPALGNHDTSTGQNPLPYISMFTLPTGGEAGGVPSGTEFYYSFNYANIHFVCLDSMTQDRSPTGPMAAWLEQDLAANTNDWVIAFWHHPPYTKGSHDSDTEGELIEMRENMLPILESYGADLVLCGHSHSYERSFLLHGHYGPSSELASNPGLIRDRTPSAYAKSPGPTNALGTVYVVAGSSGQTSGGSLDHPAMFISLNRLGSLVLDVNSNRLDAQFLESTGEVSDHFTILKGDEFRITSFRVLPGAVTISWRAEAGRTYYIDYKASLSDANWTPVSGGIVAQGTQASWTGLRQAGAENAFYRVVRLGD